MTGKTGETPVRVMLVCDLPLVALGLQRLLAGEGRTMVLAGCAGNLADALRLLAKTPTDVILLDLDGDNRIDMIQELLAAGQARVLVLSASRDLDGPDTAVLAGASGAVNKREPVEVLLKAIEKVHAGEFWVDRSATVRILMSIARRKATPDPEQDKIALLTRKERLTVAEVTCDATAGNREIAERLHISENTLRNHLSAIYGKLGLRGRMELYAYARKHNLYGRTALKV